MYMMSQRMIREIVIPATGDNRKNEKNEKNNGEIEMNFEKLTFFKTTHARFGGRKTDKIADMKTIVQLLPERKAEIAIFSAG